jgi:hypothetical protein
MTDEIQYRKSKKARKKDRGRGYLQNFHIQQPAQKKYSVTG